jgi:host factor-I protein
MSTPSDPTRPAGNAPAASGATAAATPHKRSQEPFLNDLRKRKLHVEIYLMSGVRLTGTIESFDAQMVLLKSHDVLELVNKQLISTIVPARRPEKGRGGPRRDMGDRGDRPPMKMRRPAPMTGDGGAGGGGGTGPSGEGPRVSYRSRRTLTRTPGGGEGGGSGS